MQDMPVGIPFYLKKNENGIFSHTLATDRKDFSKISLDYLNFVGTHFDQPVRTIITGEKVVTVKGKKYRVDGYVEQNGKKYFIEFHGCRLVLYMIYYIIYLT